MERLQLQSRIWEPAGRRVLDEIGDGRGNRVVDVGCGAVGWPRLLSDWVGPNGQVVGTEIQDEMLEAAGCRCAPLLLWRLPPLSHHLPYNPGPRRPRMVGP